MNILSVSRCRHGARATYFSEPKPPCDKACDFCSDPKEVERQTENLKRGVYANTHAKRHQGRTMMVVEEDGPDDSMYGGGRKGAKQ